MTRGFSLVELLVAILVLQLGVLAVTGTVLLAQRTMSRAQLTLRAVLEAEWIGDSILAREGEEVGSGSTVLPWGSVEWTPADLGIGGLRLVATLGPGEDTVAVVFLWPRLPDTLLSAPPGFQTGMWP
jgi:hypothetical protein